MFGQYKRIRNEFTGVLTGKGIGWGGSLIRPEATGYGNVYFAQNMLAEKGDSFKGKTVVISGSGNVAQYSCEKAIELGAKVVTMSDSSGFIHDSEGIDSEKLAFIMHLKNVKRGRIKEYADQYGCEFKEEGRGESLVTLLYLALLKTSLMKVTPTVWFQMVVFVFQREQICLLLQRL